MALETAIRARQKRPVRETPCQALTKAGGYFLMGYTVAYGWARSRSENRYVEDLVVYPIAEEFIFRGACTELVKAMQLALRGRVSRQPPSAQELETQLVQRTTITAAIFAATHYGPDYNLYDQATFFWRLGRATSYLRETKGLIAAMILHGAHNNLSFCPEIHLFKVGNADMNLPVHLLLYVVVFRKVLRRPLIPIPDAVKNAPLVQRAWKVVSGTTSTVYNCVSSLFTKAFLSCKKKQT